MFNKSKKFLSLMLCVLMCISMLTAIVVPANAEIDLQEAGDVDPYAAIQATENADGTYTPTKGVFVYVGAPASGEVTYTYGDGVTWGNGKTYKLVGGKTAFSKMSAAIHYVESQWNAYTGAYSKYTGPDTVVVTPGEYGGSSWQDNKQITMNLPRDEEGDVIQNPAYYELFTYTVLGPQAGKDPTPTEKADIASGRLINGRSTSTATEAVSTSTMWMPQNGQLVVDGFAFRGSHNFYGSSSKVSVVMKNIVHKYDAIYDNGLYRYNSATANVNIEFHNYAMEYLQLANGSVKDNLNNFNMQVTRLLMDNYYEYGGNLQYVSDQYTQAHMMNFYPTTTDNIQENFLGAGNKTAYFGFINSTLSHNRTTHWIRTRMGNDPNVPNRVYSNNAKNSMLFEVRDSYFYNAGDYCATNYSGSVSGEGTGVTDVFSFQDAWSLPEGALEFAFSGNTVEYTADCLQRHPDGSGNGLVMLSASNDATKQNFWFKNTTMILPSHSCKDAISLSESDQKIDRSSMLVLNDKGEVMAAGMASNQDIINDVYAGDDFQGGIAEMFTIKTATDMAFNVKVNSANTGSMAPTPVTADLLIVPYASEKAHPVEELFTFRGNKVKFVSLQDSTGADLTEAKPSDLDGAKMVASYKGKTTTCYVTFNIKVATENDMVFIDANNSATSYTFNGKTYTLNSTNRVPSFEKAYNRDNSSTNKPFWIVLPGTHNFVGGNADRIYDVRATILGPKMGISPLNENNDLDFKNRGISGTSVPYTVDTNEEAVLGGRVTVYGSQSRLIIDGVVLSNTFGFSPSDAPESWGLATGGALMGVDTNNVLVNGIISGNFVDGLSSGENLKLSKAKRYFNASNTAFCSASSGLIVSSGLYDINFDHIYASGGKGEIIRTRMPAGVLMDMSPMECGLSITNSKIENWGTTSGNWLYTNYADYTKDSSWGLSAYCSGEYFPAGVHQIFENNTFTNIGKAGCQTKGYALRLGIPGDMDNAKLIFRNNTVTEETLSTYRFIDLCGTAGTYLHEENVDISGNVFINFKEPFRFAQNNANTSLRSMINVDDNYHATTVDGKEVVPAITAEQKYYVEKSDWYYMNRKLTVKDTDFGLDLSSVSEEFTVSTFPNFSADATLYCGVATITPDDIKGVEGMQIIGLYSDAACENALSGAISANTIYAKTKVDDVEIVFTINLSKAAAHSWSEYVTTIDPDCENEGEAVRTCTTCALDESKVLPNLGHVESEPTYVPATCTENAGIYIVCVRCQEEISGTEIPNSALGHDWDDWKIVVTGACTVDEVSERVCERCAEVEQDIVTAPGHTWGEWSVIVKPTCTEEGVQTRICSVCTASENLPVIATGHDSVTVITHATCVDAGKEETVCKTCGYVDEALTVIIPATGIHTWGNMIQKDPTCSTEGSSERFCKVCEIVDTATQVFTPVDPDNHTYDPDGKDWVITEGDCLTPTVKTRKCAACEHEDTVEDATAVTGKHAYETVITPATNDQTGKEEKVCKVCGDTIFVKLLPRTAAFSDVSSKAWYAEYVSKAVAAGLFKGYEDGTFRPENNITRAEVVVLFARIAGVNTAKYSTAKFTDVAKGSWYNGAIAWAEQNKIVSGRSEKTFDPNGNINRQELCTILVRYTKHAGITLNMNTAKAVFADDAKIANFAKDSVYLCQRAGIISGRPGNNFAPTGYATRAEVAKILVIFMEDYVK